MSARQRLAAVTAGASTTPLLVLFGLNFVDELDQILFGIATPEIRDDLALSDSGIILIAAAVAVFVLFAVLPVTYLADRFNRVRLVFFAALGWMTMSVLTGLAGWSGLVLLLVVARMGSGLGRTVNDPVHASLLTDYYEPDAQPKVFALHRAANPISRVTAVVIGAGAGLLGWQAMFLVLAAPTLLLIGAATRLPNPRRGATTAGVIDLVDVGDGGDGVVDLVVAAREEEASEASGEEHVSFGEARRTLFAIPSMRRLYLGSVMLGTGFLTIGTISALFFEEVYGFTPLMRGVQATFAGAGTLVGLQVGQRLASRAIAERRFDRLATITGLAFTAGAAGLVLMAAMPFALGSFVFSVVATAGFSAFQPAYYPLVALVTPGRIRTQAYGWSLIFVGVGGLVGSLFVGGLAESSYRTAMVGLAVLVGLAGLCGATAARFVRRDVAQAQQALDLTADLEAARQAGADALLVCRGVEVAYDQVQVLFGVDMVVRQGECVALLGTNGAGKSTLLKAISGVVDPMGGTVLFEGRDITHLDAASTTAAGVIQVPGGKAVFPTLTVAEHLRAAGWLYRDDPAHLEAATAEVLETFPRLRERIDQMAGNLSGGEQQMLALGMAFIAKPKLLVIDELSLGLAPTIVEQLLGIVRRIQASGTAIVLVEQSINVALTVADRAYFMEKGEVRFEGPTAELLERDDIVRSVFLEGAGSVSTRTDVGPEAVAVREREEISREGEPVLALHGVTKRFGGITAVDDASFDLHRGEILGLIGPNGAGKTTIFDLVSGFLVPDDGRIRLDGVDITELGPDKRAWMGLGRSFQDARLAGSLTVAENIAIGLERHLEIRDHLASLLNLPLVVRQEEDVSWTVDDLIELMNLGAFRDKFVRELSTGSRRIVDLAMCVAHDPTVLLLDEPSSGIAQRETEALGPLLQRIQAETGCALLVIEHDMPLITGISDRMVALELGHPIVEGTPAQVVSDPRVVSSYLGGDMATINRSGTAVPPVPAPGDDDSGGPARTGRPRREPLRAT
ncbi:MAG TPA: MFS transporter [Acidimicrobiales bacterium]|nr:MFS transporter [Acidimicrobiales bacterium]